MRIRRATPEDLEAMHGAKHAAGLAAWPHILPEDTLDRLGLPERWRRAIDSEDDRTAVLVAEEGARVVGFAIVRSSEDEDAEGSTGELDAFYTHPSVWGRGAGRALLREAVTVLRDAGFTDATLWTAEQNHRPRRIYERAGWRTDRATRRRRLDGVEFGEVRYRLRLT